MAALGQYPMMSLSDARAERDRMRALVKGGANPAHVARVERAAQIEREETAFAVVALEHLAEPCERGLSPSLTIGLLEDALPRRQNKFALFVVR